MKKKVNLIISLSGISLLNRCQLIALSTFTMAILVVGSQVKYIVLKAEILEVLVKIERRQKGKKKCENPSLCVCACMCECVCMKERRVKEEGREKWNMLFAVQSHCSMIHMRKHVLAWLRMCVIMPLKVKAFLDGPSFEYIYNPLSKNSGLCLLKKKRRKERKMALSPSNWFIGSVWNK